jgi:hypothetical protein
MRAILYAIIGQYGDWTMGWRTRGIEVQIPAWVDFSLLRSVHFPMRLQSVELLTKQKDEFISLYMFLYYK